MGGRSGRVGGRWRGGKSPGPRSSAKWPRSVALRCRRQWRKLPLEAAMEFGSRSDHDRWQREARSERQGRMAGLGGGGR
ncbi:unnamed protein product [Lampetra fluviatilis]